LISGDGPCLLDGGASEAMPSENNWPFLVLLV